MAMLMMVLLASCGGIRLERKRQIHRLSEPRRLRRLKTQQEPNRRTLGKLAPAQTRQNLNRRKPLVRPAARTLRVRIQDWGLNIWKSAINVTLVYNAGTCEVEYEVERGLGSRQTVTLTAQMKDGFLFDGWTVGKRACKREI